MAGELRRIERMERRMKVEQDHHEKKHYSWQLRSVTIYKVYMCVFSPISVFFPKSYLSPLVHHPRFSMKMGCKKIGTSENYICYFISLLKTTALVIFSRA